MEATQEVLGQMARDSELASKSITLGEKGYLMGYGDELLQVGGRVVPPLAQESIYRFEGNVDLARLPLGITGYRVIGEGSGLSILTFCIIQTAGHLASGQYGLLYLRGKGRVVRDTIFPTLNGEVKLGYESSAANQTVTTVAEESVPSVRAPETGTSTPAEQALKVLSAQWALKVAWDPSDPDVDTLANLTIAGCDGTIEELLSRFVAFGNTPAARGAFARIREAKAKQSSSKDLQVLQIGASTFRGELLTAERGAALQLDRLRTDLVGKTASLDVLDPALAQLILRLELLGNYTMTQELANSFVMQATSAASKLTAEVQTAQNEAEILMNDAITAPRAAYIKRAVAMFEQAKTTASVWSNAPMAKEIDDSRNRVRNLIKAALAQQSEHTNAFAHSREVAAAAMTENLSRSRQRLAMAIAAATQ